MSSSDAARTPLSTALPVSWAASRMVSILARCPTEDPLCNYLALSLYPTWNSDATLEVQAINAVGAQARPNQAIWPLLLLVIQPTQPEDEQASP